MSDQILQRLAIAGMVFVLAGGILAGLLQEPGFLTIKNVLSFVLGAAFSYCVILLWYDIYPAIRIRRHRRKLDETLKV